MRKIYKICLFYDHDTFEEVSQTFPDPETALRWVVLKRIELSNMFGAIIFRKKKYLNYFLTNESWKVLEFADELEWCIVSIESPPPLITYVEDFKHNEKDLIFDDKIGFQFSKMKLVLLYTGSMGKQGIFSCLLHELGHTVFDYKSKLPYEVYALRHELESWEFAKEHAEMVGISKKYIACLAKNCLDTYLSDDEKKIKGFGMPKTSWWRRYNQLIKEAKHLKIE